MSRGPMEPRPLWRWLREHPLVYGVAAGIVTALCAMASLRDIRGALVAGLYGAALVYALWRRGGPAWRVMERDQRIHEERGGVVVRPRWLLVASLAVLVAVAAGALAVAVLATWLG